MPATYWTIFRDPPGVYIAVTRDGMTFPDPENPERPLSHPDFDTLIDLFNQYRQRGDRVFPGPPPPVPPPSGASEEEVEKWLEEVGEREIWNSLDDSEEDLDAG